MSSYTGKTHESFKGLSCLRRHNDQGGAELGRQIKRRRSLCGKPWRVSGGVGRTLERIQDKDRLRWHENKGRGKKIKRRFGEPWRVEQPFNLQIVRMRQERLERLCSIDGVHMAFYTHSSVRTQRNVAGACANATHQTRTREQRSISVSSAIIPVVEDANPQLSTTTAKCKT